MALLRGRTPAATGSVTEGCQIEVLNRRFRTFAVLTVLTTRLAEVTPG